jgi:hypothetical protein
LHGLVVAEAYSIPAQFITCGEVEEEDLFKFKDYFHSTGRDLNYENFSDQTNLSFLTDQALKQCKADIDLHRLLHAFPFGLKNDLRPTLAWSSLHQWNEPPASFRPPLLREP